MLKKEQLEALLTRAMHSFADFAEIFEEEGTNENIAMINDEVERVNRTQKAGVESDSNCSFFSIFSPHSIP